MGTVWEFGTFIYAFITLKKRKMRKSKYLCRDKEKNQESVDLPCCENPTVFFPPVHLLLTSMMMGIIKLIPDPFSVAGLQPKKKISADKRERLCGVLMSLFKSLTDLQGILYHSSEPVLCGGWEGASETLH